MTAAIDIREAEDHESRAKRLATIFGWCRKCGLQQSNAEYCASCLEIINLENIIRRQAERNAKHACGECDGAGFVAGFFKPNRCEKCLGTGDARIKSPRMVAVVHHAMSNATHYVLPARVILDSMKHSRLMERIAMMVGEPYMDCEEWPEDGE